MPLVRLKFCAERHEKAAEALQIKVQTALGLKFYNILAGNPELSGGMATRLLRNQGVLIFFRDWGYLMGTQYYGVNHPCNTTNVLYDFWKEYTTTVLFLRESGWRGLEPLSDEKLDELDLSMRKQRVWLGSIAPSDDVLFDQWWAWMHHYYMHYMWFVRRYRGVGSLSQEPIEDFHKQAYKDVSAFSVAGTRVATDDQWNRIIQGYNIDLLTLRDLEKLRNGASLDTYRCKCVQLGKTCRKCVKQNPFLLLGS